jgi:long-chain acyl-CoA synthetase
MRELGDIPSWVVAWAAQPDAARPALEHNGMVVSYRDLASEMLARGGTFVDVDVPVAVIDPDPVETVLAALSVLAAGASPLLLNAHYPSPSLEAIVKRAGAVRADDLDRRAGLDRPVTTSGSVDGVLVTTSGSTGAPKVVRRSRSGDAAAALTNPLRGWPITRGSRMWAPVPVASASLLSLVMGTLVSGGTAVLDRFDPSTAGAFVRERGIDGAYFVPTMLRLAMQEADFDPMDWDGLDMMFWGGEPMSSGTHRDVVDAMGDIVHTAYGSTEVPVVAAAGPRLGRERFGTSGSATAWHGFRVVGPDGRPLSAGVEGELETRGPDAYAGYLGEDDVLPGAWYPTGDRATIDEGGYLFVSGRQSAVVNVGGNRVSPEESADAIRALSNVQHAVVVAVPDRMWGNRLHGFVVVERGTTFDVDQVLRELRRSLPSVKVPREISLVTELPVEESGKMSVRTLQQWAVGSAGEGGRA